MAQQTYRVQVFNSSSTGVDFTLNHADLVEIPERMGGQRVDLLEGKVESLDWSLDVVDRGENVTQNLSNSSGLTDLLIRRIRISRTTAAGSTTWETLATGRISQIDQVDAGYKIQVSDERLIERNVDIFTSLQSDYPTLKLPFTLGARGLQAMPEPTFNIAWDASFDSHTGDYTRLLISIQRTNEQPQLDDQQWNKFQDDATPGWGRVPRDKEDVDAAIPEWKSLYKHYRLRVATYGDYMIVGWNNYPLGPDRFANEPLPDQETRARPINSIWVYDPANELSTLTQNVATFSVSRAWAPTRDKGFLLGASPNWLRPFDLVRHIYSGAYQSTATWDGVALPVQTVRYSTDVLPDVPLFYNLYGTTAGGLVSDPTYPYMRFRVDRPWRMEEWLRTYIYKPFQVLPVASPAGEIQPVSVRLPTAEQVPTVTGLFEFDGSNAVGIPSWSLQSRDMVNRVTGRWQTYAPNTLEQWYYINIPSSSGGTLIFSPAAAEEIGQSEYVRTWQYEKAPDAYRREATFELQTWRGNFDDLFLATKDWVFERYGSGAQLFSIKAQNSAKGVNIGDHVRLNIDSIPNTALRQRGGTILATVLTKTYLRDGVAFELLYDGLALQPLAAPTFSLAKSTGDPNHTVVGTVTRADIRDRYEIHLAQATASSTAAWRIEAIGNADEDVHIGQLAMGKTYFGRCRSRRDGRVASTWTVSTGVTLSAAAAPSAVTVSTSEVTGYQAPISWTVGSSIYDTAIMTGSAATSNVVAGVIAGTNQYLLGGLTPGTTYDLYLWHVDDYGGHSAASTQVTFSTLSTTDPGYSPTLKKPAYIRLLVGTTYNPQQSS